MKVFVVLAAVCALAYDVLGSRIPLSSPRLDSRIVGGKDTDISEVPYQLSLQFFSSHICGATIINEYWALTSVNCSGPDPPYLSLRAGTSHRGGGGSVHQVELLIPHPQYDRQSQDYDYALLKVKTPFTFGPNVQAIKLADSEPQVGVYAITSGWGRKGTDNAPTDSLKSVKLPIVSHAECQKRYSDYKVTERMVCAGGLDIGGTGACKYDFGGPLASGGVLVGVASWGVGCGAPRNPNVFSDVAAVRSWINEASGV